MSNAAKKSNSRATFFALIAVLALSLSTGSLMAQQTDVSILGKGAGQAGAEPKLESSMPVIGEMTELMATNLNVNGQTYLFFSLPPAQPVTIAEGYVVQFDLHSYIFSGPFKADDSGMLQAAFGMPADAELKGLQIVVQAANATADGLELTNGLLWTLGY